MTTVLSRVVVEPLLESYRESLFFGGEAPPELAGIDLDELRRVLLLDAEFALEHDPAAESLEEVILAYPGFLAITVHRLAHELYRRGERLRARLMSEWAHGRTGADIHPGAVIGERFFLDHATGAVIGQTARLGSGVRLFHGVTLGALGPGRENPRHPKLEDDVVVYANATILGGRTVVGKGCVIGAGVYLTESVPAGHRVTLGPANLRIAPRGPYELDFAI